MLIYFDICNCLFIEHMFLYVRLILRFMYYQKNRSSPISCDFYARHGTTGMEQQEVVKRSEWSAIFRYGLYLWTWWYHGSHLPMFCPLWLQLVSMRNFSSCSWVSPQAKMDPKREKSRPSELFNSVQCLHAMHNAQGPFAIFFPTKFSC